MINSFNYNQDVKNYLEDKFSPEDKILNFVKLHSQQLGMPAIHVPALVGKWLYLLAKIQGAQRILEIGSLGAYSAIWLARSLSDKGKLIAIDSNAAYIEIARAHLEEAHLIHLVELVHGDAADVLNEWLSCSTIPFDFVFIDADKNQNKLYLDYAIRLTKPGSLIIVDNLIPKGEQVGKPCNGEAIAVYQFNDYFAQHPLLESIVVPTLVGQQGRLDGLGIARVKSL